MNRNVDLSGFPVIRIDQIPLVDSDTLRKALVEVEALIKSLLEEHSEVPPLVNYLVKQNESVQTELRNRAAQQRIDALLSGAIDFMNSTTTASTGLMFKESNDSTSAAKLNSNIDSSVNITNKVPVKDHSVSKTNFQPLPLPSEARSNKYEPCSPQRTALAGMQRSESSPAGIAMSSRSNDESGRNKFQDEYNNVGASSTSENSRPKRPQSGSEQTSGPSRRAQAIFNEKFGVSFVVLGDGKRSRRAPAPKKVTETQEEIKSRERLER